MSSHLRGIQWIHGSLKPLEEILTSMCITSKHRHTCISNFCILARDCFGLVLLTLGNSYFDLERIEVKFLEEQIQHLNHLLRNATEFELRH